MNNMELWEKLRRPPASALKKIGGGRLKGMTDIKPQWRYQAMTEQFGPCGIGWKYTIGNQWVGHSPDDQLMAFCNINLYIRVDGEWSDAIPGTGGSMLVAKEKTGMHANDEAYKMALTDALSVAMTRIGVASDIYMGQWTGSKYLTPDPVKPASLSVKDHIWGCNDPESLYQLVGKWEEKRPIENNHENWAGIAAFARARMAETGWEYHESLDKFLTMVEKATEVQDESA